MPRSVVVTSTDAGFRHEVSIGPHLFAGDEPVEVGGGDSGPNPYEFLLAALGTCTGMTVKGYAERHGWPLARVEVRLKHDKVHADDCAECETKARLVDRVEKHISLTGDLSQAQRQKLLEIANKCPVHRTLTSEIQIETYSDEVIGVPRHPPA